MLILTYLKSIKHMKQVNENITTLSVTFNNANELKRTLDSLLRVACQPKTILVVDGGSTDESLEILEDYKKKLPQLTFISEKDNGIFDAMNKGKAMVKTNLIHYLTAGDYLKGDPYKDINKPCLLPVLFIDEEGEICGQDRIKLFGTQYNHQGMILPANHNDYDTNLWIGADYKMSLEVFNKGMKKNMFINNGSVVYQLGGLSSQKTILGRIHMIKGIFKIRPLLAIPVSITIILKNLVPRRLRRLLLKYTLTEDFKT